MKTKDRLFLLLTFVILFILQVLVLNKINLHGMINPYILHGWILLLPFSLHRNFVMIIAFVVGLTLDSFLNTVGLHTSCFVLLAYFRTFLLRYLKPNLGYDKLFAPIPKYLGWKWFIKYSLIGFSFYLPIYFLLESFTWSGILFTFAKTGLSGFFSIILYWLINRILQFD